MTTFFLSINQGLTPSQANVTEGTSNPSADVQLQIGGGTMPNANISRAFVVAALNAFLAYVTGDDKRTGGPGTLVLME